jgi:hypothetical protein
MAYPPAVLCPKPAPSQNWHYRHILADMLDRADSGVARAEWTRAG